MDGYSILNGTPICWDTESGKHDSYWLNKDNKCSQCDMIFGVCNVCGTTVDSNYYLCNECESKGLEEQDNERERMLRVYADGGSY